MVKVAVVDDDINFCKAIACKIENTFNKFSTTCHIDCFYDEQILNCYHKYDVIFLDIELGETSGIDIIRQIREVTKGLRFPLICFITGMDNSVFAALGEMPFSYIRKYNIDDLLEKNIEKLIYEINLRSKGKEKIVISRNNNKTFIYLDDVYCIESAKNYVIYYTTIGEFKERALISQKEIELKDKGFMRINSGCIINRKHIFSFTKNEVVLNNNLTLCISSGYKDRYNLINEGMVNMYD